MYEDKVVILKEIYKSMLCVLVRDAFFSKSNNKYNKINQKESREYLMGAFPEDLQLVCQIADISYDRVVSTSKYLASLKQKELDKIVNKAKRSFWT